MPTITLSAGGTTGPRPEEAAAARAAEPEGYIDKRELAKRLGRTARSVDTYMAKGIVPFYKLGRTVAFKWSEVDEYIRTHCRVGVVRGKC